MLLILGMVKLSRMRLKVCCVSNVIVFLLFVVFDMLYFNFGGSECIILCLDNFELFVINIGIVI